jgi:hypothetical protein
MCLVPPQFQNKLKELIYNEFSQMLIMEVLKIKLSTGIKVKVKVVPVLN